MIDKSFYLYIWIWMLIAVLIIPVLLFTNAPYGRYFSNKWGLLINNKLGWFIMESPALFVFVYFFLIGESTKTTVYWIIFSLWVIHYFQRVFIFPFTLKTKGKKMPFTIMIMALFFNLINGYINGYYLGNVSGRYNISWIYDPRFIIGIIMFISGMIINKHSDNILIKLRIPGNTTYKIPYGGFFRYVSTPNYFGEIIEWAGFAVLCWNVPALAFCMWSIANLLPRAINHHKWYKSHFSDYPQERKAVIPFIL